MRNNALPLYFKDVFAIPLLSAKEERALFKRYSRSHARELRDRIVCSNLRLVVKCAARWPTAHLSFSDRVQAGTIGLIKAVDRFDYRRGTRFSTYASWWIKHEILNEIEDKEQLIRIPKYKYAMLRTCLRVLKACLSSYEHGRVSPRLISKKTRLPLALVNELMELGARKIYSLDDIIDDQGSTLHERVGGQHLTSPEELASNSALHAILLEAMRKLPAREYEIVMRRYGFYGEDETLESIGQSLGLSRERIRQLHDKALKRLGQKGIRRG